MSIQTSWQGSRLKQLYDQQHCKGRILLITIDSTPKWAYNLMGSNVLENNERLITHFILIFDL